MNQPQKIEAAEAASLALPRLATPSRAQANLAPTGRDMSVYHKKMARVLAAMGSIYLLDDILARVAEGKMQSFCVNNSWAITEVCDYPRARQLTVIAYVGDLPDLEALDEQVLAYAAEIGARLVAAYGRRGWAPHAARLGWRLKAKTYLFQREI